MTFLLSTEQYEVLMAFEETASLNELAKAVRRDPSVVSRALKAISEVAPLVEKSSGKWRIMPLGRQFNRLTRGYLQTQRKLIDQEGPLRLAPANLPTIGKSSALLLLGTQLGFLSPQWGPRNNPDIVAKLERLLAVWRDRRDPVLFCPHHSKKADSPLAPGTRGGEFIASLAPRKSETVIAKSHNSAFVGTDLAKRLRKKKIENVILAGFSTCHCVDATARAAFDEGFNVYVIGDAAATFDRVGPDGKYYRAETLHASTLAALHQEYATVVDSDLFLTDFASDLR